MSTFVDSLNQVSQLNDEYNTLLQKKKDELSKAAEAFNNDIQARLNFYNTVLYNTFKKFNTPVEGYSQSIGQMLYSKHKIRTDIKIETSYRDSCGNLILVSATDNISIPFEYLRFDPIIISQYARRLVRKEQVEQARNQHAKYSKEQKSLQTQVNRLTRELETAKRKTTIAEAQVDNVTNHILNKRRGKKK